MDPNLFALDWDRTAEVLATIIVLAFMLERALAWLFELEWWVRSQKARAARPFVTIVAAAWICWYLKFDAFSIILPQAKTNAIGYIVTAMVIAGGSKASIALFRDVMGAESTVSKRERASRVASVRDKDATLFTRTNG